MLVGGGDEGGAVEDDVVDGGGDLGGGESDLVVVDGGVAAGDGGGEGAAEGAHPVEEEGEVHERDGGIHGGRRRGRF